MRVPKPIFCGLVWLTSLVAVADMAPAADNDALLQQAHAWARFGNDSWRKVRIVTQDFDEEGVPTNSSITDNTTTVLDVTPERVTLKVEVTLELAGQRFDSQPQIIKQGYAGETVGQTVSVKSLEGETVSIDGMDVRCEKEQIEILGGVTREVSLISFADKHIPAILKRKSTMSDAAGTKTVQEATSEVKAIDMPRRLLNELEPKSAYLVRQEQRNEHGITTTWSWHVPEVPGEIVDQCSKKVDNQGRLVRRTTLELVGYNVTSMAQDDLSRDVGGRRARRAKRRQ